MVDFEADKADEVTALNITGSADTKLVVDADVMDVNAVVIDASALSGKFEITDNSGSLKTGSSVIGTDQDDTIEVDDNTGVSYSAGAGDDGFTTLAATLAATGNDDTSLDGGAGEDTLTVSDTAATLTDNNFVNVSNMEKLVLSGTDDHSVTVGANFASAFGSEATITAKDMTEADHDFAYAGGLYNGDVTIDVEAATIGDSAGEDFSVTTGDGADVVNLALESFLGAATGGKITVDTDKGNDDITVSIGTIADDAANQTITINAGEGADTVELTKVNGNSGDGTHKSNALFIVDEGDSTLSARDVVTGFDKAENDKSSDVLDFTGTSVATDFTSSVDSGVIKSHSVTNGVVTFDDVDTFDTALTIDDSNLDDVLGYLAENTAKLDTAAFGFDSTGDGSADATMVYNNNDTDSLVELVGVTGVGSLITDTASTADALSIA